MIEYALNGPLSSLEWIELMNAVPLEGRGAVGPRPTVRAMLRASNLLVTARDNGRLVGAARSLSDFMTVTYLADLAVRPSHRRRGIGRALVDATQAAAPTATLVALAAPTAASFYSQARFTAHGSAWFRVGTRH